MKSGSKLDGLEILQLVYKVAPLFLGNKNDQKGTSSERKPNLALDEKDIALLNVKKKDGSLSVLLGSRDTGKTELSYRYAEFLGRPTFAVSPQQNTPSWITRIRIEEIFSRLPRMSTLILDDLPSYASNRDYNDGLVQTIEKVIPMIRHEPNPPEFPVGQIHLIVCSQSAAQADKYMTGDCDICFLKPLGLLMNGMERPNVARIYRELVDVEFEGKDDMFIKRHAYMLSRGFRGLVTVSKTS